MWSATVRSRVSHLVDIDVAMGNLLDIGRQGETFAVSAGALRRDRRMCIGD
jgi:hypothetical protein